MSVVLTRPAVNKEACRNKDASRDHQGDAKLGAADVIVPFLQSTIDTIIYRSANLSPEEEADAQRDVVQATNANGLVVLLFPESWKRGQDKVHKAVKICHVYG